MVELVLTMGLLVVVLGSILGIFQVVQRQAAFVKDRSESIDEMRIAVDRMTKEIRQASIVVPSSTASRLEMTTYVLGVEKEIVYEAVGETLTRTVDGSEVVLQEDLVTTNVFTYTGDTGGVIQVVALTLNVHPVRRPNTTLVLTSEVRIRNRLEVA